MMKYELNKILKTYETDPQKKKEKKMTINKVVIHNFECEIERTFSYYQRK